MARPRSRVRPLEASGNRRPREMTVARASPLGAQNPAYRPSLALFVVPGYFALAAQSVRASALDLPAPRTANTPKVSVTASDGSVKSGARRGFVVSPPPGASA